jgi:hypothetical protein
MSESMAEVVRLMQEIRAELTEVKLELARMRKAEPEQTLLPFRGPPPSEQLVSLDQIAAIARRRKRGLERYKKGMPGPRDPGGHGRTALWAWSDVRPWLEATFGRPFPESFPSYAAG